jgi:hypothetical protein
MNDVFPNERKKMKVFLYCYRAPETKTVPDPHEGSRG